MSSFEPPERSAESQAGAPTFGGFWLRLAAYLIDTLPILLATAAVFYWFLGFDEHLRNYLARGSRDVKARAEFLTQRNFVRDTGMGFYILYAAWLESSPWQATVGKRLLGLVVVDRSGNRLTFGRAMARNLCKLLSMLPCGLGFVRAGWSREKRALHDLLAGTYVVERRADHP